MPTKNPTRPYDIPGFRICLVRGPGVSLAEKPALITPAAAAPVLRAPQWLPTSARRTGIGRACSD
jgi:hypothetical protein